MDLVDLAGGLVLPLEACQLAWRLESDGWEFSVDGETLRLRRSDGRQDCVLSDSDREGVKQWKKHLIAAVSYTPPNGVGAKRTVSPPKRRAKQAKH